MFTRYLQPQAALTFLVPTPLQLTRRLRILLIAVGVLAFGASAALATISLYVTDILNYNTSYNAFARTWFGNYIANNAVSGVTFHARGWAYHPGVGYIYSDSTIVANQPTYAPQQSRNRFFTSQYSTVWCNQTEYNFVYGACGAHY